MDINDILKKLITGLVIGGILAGTVVALVGLYLRELNISVTGLLLILVSMLVVEILFRKLRML